MAKIDSAIRSAPKPKPQPSVSGCSLERHHRHPYALALAFDLDLIGPGSSEASRGQKRRNSHQSVVFGEAGNGTVVGIYEL